MPQLHWNEIDFIECLEVAPETNEFSTEHHFTVIRDGLTLKVSVWQYDSVVYLDLYRSGMEAPLIGLALFVRGPVDYVKEGTWECLRFQNALPAPSRFSYLDFERDIHSAASIPYGLTVTLRVKPDIKIAFDRNIA